MVIGTVAQQVINFANDLKVSILTTLVLSSLGYVLAQKMNISGPLAIVIAGLIVGYNQKKMAPKLSKVSLMAFWELIEELINILLFLLLGLELLLVPLSGHNLMIAMIMIPGVLIARLITVAIPMAAFKKYKIYPPKIVAILTWGGLRGALALSMALSLPNGETRNFILLLTYVVVIFSIIVQGLTIKKLLPNPNVL